MSKTIYYIMGVSGSGKTTIAQMLSLQLGIDFFDADSFHSSANIQKMSAAIPLSDDDRFSWLMAINHKAQENLESDKSAVIACSALKEKYRKILSANIEKNVVWIYLKGDIDTISKRISARKGHFMHINLLQSQFDILEEPVEGITINMKSNPKEIIKEIMDKLKKSTFGLVGLGVMGKSLARNLANKGVRLSLFNQLVVGSEEQVAEKFISQFPELQNVIGFESIEDFVDSLEQPRKIFLMIKAGKDTDTFLELLLPHLDPEDIVIDGGNSHYMDTRKRIEYLKTKNMHFIGTGVSGGEYGALHGPSMMPSGDAGAYKQIAPFFNAIAAKDKNGLPCCAYIGEEGSGHFIKMVHNGIEYAEMQLIAEVYAYLRFIAHFQPEQISNIFSAWAQTDLKSYLLEITAKILLKKENDNWLIDQILDKAGNKGTGNWATIAASELGIPATMITAALFARYLSTIKEKYTKLHLLKPTDDDKNNNNIDIENIKAAYQISRIINHQQGFLLIKTASELFQWNLDLNEIARIWTNGCIIRSTLMEDLVGLFDEKGDMFLNEYVIKKVNGQLDDLKKYCISSLQHELPIPCHFAAFDYINTFKNNHPSANIIQAQRDFFGAHTYKKLHDMSDKNYHTEW